MRTPAATAAGVASFVALVALVALAGCGGPAAGEAQRSSPPPSPTPSVASSAPAPSDAPQAGARVERSTPPGPRPSDGAPRPATLTVDRIGMAGLAVRPYRGTTDDATGTGIQDGGVLASPHGPDGGVGPGGVGNYLVTGHRLSSTQAFLDLPSLSRGDRVTVRSADRAYVYEVRRTRVTSFRDPASLEAQRAPVPGRPGVRPTRAMITLSTCRTPEDRAEGNDWSDEFGNPENRIDKIGVLVASRPV